MPGPKRINPDIRFAQEVMLWRTAEQHGSIALAQPTTAKAINLRHRLNMCRAVYRDMTAGAWLEWDNFTVKLTDATVIIERKDAIDLSQVYAVTEDGRKPLSPTDIMLADGDPLPSWQPTPPAPGAIQPTFKSTHEAAREKDELAKIYEETRPKAPQAPSSVPVYKGHSGVFPKDLPPPPETFDPSKPLDLNEE